MDFTFALLDTITNNFSDGQRIGSGGYGDCYRAVHNGEEIAVKKLHQLQGLDDKQFHNEFRNLTMVSHKNVIRLIGYCYESRSKYVKQNGVLVFAKMMERLLCFEYMQGGSLEKCIADGPCRLDWPTCYKIIQGTCDGLNHLHNAQEKAIFHLDLKPSNILLDKNMTPKIAGLGLSRLVDSAKSHTTVMRDGTLGYMPPEYIERGIISNKFDVFSLGRIILKMMDGEMGAYRYCEMSPNQYIDHVSENWKERLQTMSERSSYEVHILRVRACVEIALRCVDKDREKRPSIKEILWELGMKTIIPLPTEHKSISFVLSSQSSSRSAPDQPTDLIETEIKTNQTEAEIKTNRTEAEIKTMLSVHPDQSGLDSQLCSTTAPDYSKDQIEAEIETIMSLPPDHKSNWSGLDSESRSVTDRPKDLILQTGSEPQLSLQYLKDITNNFSDVLGKGGFGVVYKGVLQNGEIVAVKKPFQAMQSTQKQFENEVNLLMKLKHPNIVRLVGYCYDTQHLRTPHEGKFVFTSNTESLLCLEYVPNGTLEKYISDASSGLDWHTRCKIIEGVSYGLQYLHENSNELIIHLDLKPANILLDGNMLPKITDFGLSRLYDQTHTIQTEVITGTRGYMPPEYVERGIITPMSDIFSLGVIIMEVITGHRGYPYDIKKESEDFIKLELQKWRNRLQKEPSYTSLEIDCHQIERCIQIGLICVNPERNKRPTMKTIIDMLQGLGSMN